MMKKSTIILSCHKGPVEVHPGFWLGDQDEGEDALKKGLADIAVPLNKMDGDVWDKWDGEIIYIPITDFSVLPREIAQRKARELSIRIMEGERLSMFCFGGHGRTGYMASLVLGLLGYKDPIAFLREHYCKNAVECETQVRQIAEILGNPEINNHSPSKATRANRHSLWSYHEDTITDYCGTCLFFADCGGTVSKYSPACKFYQAE